MILLIGMHVQPGQDVLTTVTVFAALGVPHPVTVAAFVLFALMVEVAMTIIEYI